MTSLHLIIFFFRSIEILHVEHFMPIHDSLSFVRGDFRCGVCQRKNAFHCEHETPYRDKYLDFDTDERSQTNRTNDQQDTKKIAKENDSTLNHEQSSTNKQKTIPTEQKKADDRDNRAQKVPKPAGTTPYVPPLPLNQGTSKKFDSGQIETERSPKKSPKKVTTDFHGPLNKQTTNNFNGANQSDNGWLGIHDEVRPSNDASKQWGNKSAISSARLAQLNNTRSNRSKNGSEIVTDGKRNPRKGLRKEERMPYIPPLNLASVNNPSTTQSNIGWASKADEERYRNAGRRSVDDPSYARASSRTTTNNHDSYLSTDGWVPGANEDRQKYNAPRRRNVSSNVIPRGQTVPGYSASQDWKSGRTFERDRGYYDDGMSYRALARGRLPSMNRTRKNTKIHYRFENDYDYGIGHRYGFQKYRTEWLNPVYVLPRDRSRVIYVVDPPEKRWRNVVIEEEYYEDVTPVETPVKPETPPYEPPAVEENNEPPPLPPVDPPVNNGSHTNFVIVADPNSKYNRKDKESCSIQ
jgi:hypothetical protein